MPVNVQKVVDNVAQLMARVAQLTKSDVLVGIPASKGLHANSAMTNADIGRVQEFGSPAHNIPPRPFLFPAVRKVQPQIIALLRQGGQDALLGRGSIDTTLNQVGLVARNAAVAEITDPAPPFAPLQPATIRARMRKTAGGRRKLRQFKKKGGFAAYAYATDPVTGNPVNVKPLIDTGQLRRSITWVVRKAG